MGLKPNADRIVNVIFPQVLCKEVNVYVTKKDFNKKLTCKDPRS